MSCPDFSMQTIVEGNKIRTKKTKVDELPQSLVFDEKKPVETLYGLYDKLPKAIRDLHSGKSAPHIILLDDDIMVLERNRRELAYVYPESPIEASSDPKKIEEMLDKAGGGGRQVVLVSDIYMKRYVNGEIQGKNGDEVLRDLSQRGKLEGVGVVVNTRSVVGKFTEPLFAHIAECENLEQMVDMVDRFEPTLVGIPFTRVRKYRDLRKLMYAIDAVSVKAKKSDIGKTEKFLSGYKPTVEVPSEKEDIAIRIHELAGLMYTSIVKMREKIEEVNLPEEPSEDEYLKAIEYESMEKIFIAHQERDNAISYGDKFIRRFRGEIPGQEITVENILRSPLLMGHEINGGVVSLEHAFHLTGDENNQRDAQLFGNAVSQLFNKIEEPEGPKTTDVVKLIDDISEDFFTVRRKYDISTNVKAAGVKVMGDEYDIRHPVVFELIQNSERHARLNGREVKIELGVDVVKRDSLPQRFRDRFSGDEVVDLTVKDESGGIDAEELPKIFEKGWTKGGSGLGLTILMDTVEKDLGGAVQVESTKGIGTTFHIYLNKKNEDDDISGN